MDKGKAPSLFVNDGSFMERFKQLQQDQGPASKELSKASSIDSETPVPKPVVSKFSIGSKTSNNSCKTTPVLSSGKLAFSLKQKSKVVAPIKLSEDEDEEEEDKDPSIASGNMVVKRLKLGQPDSFGKSSEEFDGAPSLPSNTTVKDVADRLAVFVARNGKHLEDTTRQKNPGDTPFKFLFDESCADYKYYQYRLSEEKKALSQGKDTQAPQNGKKAAASGPTSVSQMLAQRHSNYQTPASALYEPTEDTGASASAGKSSGPTSDDPVAMMEFYARKAAQEERRRQPRQSKDEMPPPPSLQGGVKKGHHMGDFIPQEELDKFLSSCSDATARKAAKEAIERAKIQSDNVGHKLLSKMGWREGEGLGSSRSGIADPIAAGDVKRDNLGVGAYKPGEVTPDDDIYEQYKKRMMLGYRHRPNPLNNPRKSYY